MPWTTSAGPSYRAAVSYIGRLTAVWTYALPSLCPDGRATYSGACHGSYVAPMVLPRSASSFNTAAGAISTRLFITPEPSRPAAIADTTPPCEWPTKDTSAACGSLRAKGNGGHRVVNLVGNGHVHKVAFALSMAVEVKTQHSEAAFKQPVGHVCHNRVVHAAGEAVAYYRHVALPSHSEFWQLKARGKPSHGTVDVKRGVGLRRNGQATHCRHNSKNHLFQSHKSFLHL